MRTLPTAARGGETEALTRRKIRPERNLLESTLWRDQKIMRAPPEVIKVRDVVLVSVKVADGRVLRQ
jgi:hypothetical protein